MLSDLPRDVAEDVLSRLPVKSMRAVRFVCKNWNNLCKSRKFRKRHLGEIKAASEFMGVVMIGLRLHLASINLHKGLEPSINDQGKLTDGVDIIRVCQCDGLLLCILRCSSRMVVWNPYLGQTRWFKPMIYDYRPEWYSYRYVIGYEPNSKSPAGRNYKILRYFESSPGYCRYEVYYLNKSRNDTIRVTFFSDWETEFDARGASVKGNTYWFAQEKIPPDGVEIADFLVCFDFTRERFGPRLRLPIHSYAEDCVALYSVRDEQLAVLYQPYDALSIEIWITNKIEPDEVSWNSKVFLAVDMSPLDSFCNFPCESGSFFVDEEKKVVVVFNNDKAYVIGEGGGSIKVVDFGITPDIPRPYPPVISYVPSNANQATSRQKEETKLLNTQAPKQRKNRVAQ